MSQVHSFPPGKQHVRHGSAGTTHCVQHGEIEPAFLRVSQVQGTVEICEECLWDEADFEKVKPQEIVIPACQVHGCECKSKQECKICDKLVCEGHSAMPGLCTDCDLQLSMGH